MPRKYSKYRKILAVMSLAMLLLGIALPSVATLMGDDDHACNCTEGLCRCIEHHGKKPQQKCHQPQENSKPSFAQCESEDEEITVFTPRYILSDTADLDRLSMSNNPTGSSGIVAPEQTTDVIPPPPRS